MQLWSSSIGSYGQYQVSEVPASTVSQVDSSSDTSAKRSLCRIKVIDKKALPSMTMDEDNDSDAEEGDTTMPTGSATFKPTKLNPTFLMLYGHAMASGKSYQSAIGARNVTSCGLGADCPLQYTIFAHTIFDKMIRSSASVWLWHLRIAPCRDRVTIGTITLPRLWLF